MRTVYGDHERFEQTYFSTYKANTLPGDGCRRDADGYYWITAASMTSSTSPPPHGHRRSRDSLVAHAKFGSRGRGYPHDIKGQGIYAYVHYDRTEPSEALRRIGPGCARTSPDRLPPI